MRSLPRREFFADTAKLAAAMAAIPGMKSAMAADDGDGDRDRSRAVPTTPFAWPFAASMAGAKNISLAGVS